VQGYR